MEFNDETSKVRRTVWQAERIYVAYCPSTGEIKKGNLADIIVSVSWNLAHYPTCEWRIAEE